MEKKKLEKGNCSEALLKFDQQNVVYEWNKFGIYKSFWEQKLELSIEVFR